MGDRKRLDVLLFERGLAESREKAQRLIRAGLVHSDNERLEKPGRMVPVEISLRVKGTDCPYVSRGGLKIEGALDQFGCDPVGKVCVDLGASTGGFTDCLLQRGAAQVYAIDVGRGQLHERIRQDDRVVSREGTHIDSLEARQFDPTPTLAVADLRFISLTRLFPVLKRILPEGAEAICLVKPQFEVGKDRVPKGGVVTDPRLHERVLRDLSYAAKEEGLEVLGTMQSPIKGTEGNIEFFLRLRV